MATVVCIINDVQPFFIHHKIKIFFFTSHLAHECDFVDNKIICSCRKGYKVDDEDEKNCIDINECENGENFNGGLVECFPQKIFGVYLI